MSQSLYYLMHRDDAVCVVSIDTVSGEMLRAARIHNPELLPLGGRIDTESLRRWWHRRAVPISQGKIRLLLNTLEISTPQEYLVKNMGLSLIDHYWIKPAEMSLSWKEVNLFSNDFLSPGKMEDPDPMPDPGESDQLAFSPISSTQGELRKKWIIQGGKRILIKGNHGGSSQESLNEIFATRLHQKQQKQPFVAYHPLRSGEKGHINCFCECFTSERLEFVPAVDLIHSRKKKNNVSSYEHLIQVCESYGLEEERVRSFLEYQILTDFILTNTDRHLNNYGILRDTNTLQFVDMAPIFDSGNSMFCEDPSLPERSDLMDITVNSLLKKESKMLELVRNPAQLDMELLPDKAEMMAVYRQDPAVSSLDSIWKGYQKKTELLRQFMNDPHLFQKKKHILYDRGLTTEKSRI